MPRVVVIDNYDSFVYNLVQYLGELGADPDVYRPDEISLEALEELRPDAIVISPGPGRPEDAKLSNAVIQRFAGPRSGAEPTTGHTCPILGVCLGHQCIGAAFGGVVGRAAVGPMHGKTSPIEHDGTGVFRDVLAPFEATRYHSLVALPPTMPAELKVNARTQDGTIMGLRHERLPIHGVQFHPESIETRFGHRMLKNFLAFARPEMAAA